VRFHLRKRSQSLAENHPEQNIPGGFKQS